MPYLLVEQPGHVPEYHVQLRDCYAREQALIERERGLLNKHQALSAALEDLHQAYRREMRALIGDDRYDANIERQRAIQEQFVGLRARFAATPDGERARQEQRRKLLREKHDLYHGLGIDINRAVAIRKAHLAEVKSVAATHIDLDLEQAARPLGEPPTPRSNPWTWYTAPYAHQWNRVLPPYSSAGSISVTANSWASSGELNLTSRIGLFGASDRDQSWTDAMCEVGFWFRMPAAGMIEVWAWFQDINTDYFGFLEDEAGCSDAYVRQLSRMYLWTGGSSERYVTVLDYPRGEEEGSWVKPLTKTGEVSNKQFFSQKSYAGGEWIYVALGVRDVNFFEVDDMSCSSQMYSHWFVKQVAVRSTGAP